MSYDIILLHTNTSLAIAFAYPKIHAIASIVVMSSKLVVTRSRSFDII